MYIRPTVYYNIFDELSMMFICIFVYKADILGELFSVSCPWSLSSTGEHGVLNYDYVFVTQSPVNRINDIKYAFLFIYTHH